MKKNTKTWKKTIIEWGVLLGVIVLLNVTGWNKPISAFLHRAAFAVGLFQPKVPTKIEASGSANLNMPLRTLDGETLNLNDFRGKTIFLNFWATWCPPCLAEMPGIQALYDSMQTDSIAFVMVATDQRLDEVTDYLKNHRYTFPVYRLAGSVPRAFASNTIPATFVIDANGVVVYRHFGMADYSNEEFKQFLKR